MKTSIPFMPKIRLVGEEVESELYEEILKIAKEKNLDPQDFSAKFELSPLPEPEKEGHFLMAEVVYQKGELK